MTIIATSTLVNGISVMAVDFIAALIGVYFLARYLREKKTLILFVSILGLALGSELFRSTRHILVACIHGSQY